MKKTVSFIILVLSLSIIFAIATWQCRNDNILSELQFSTQDGMKIIGEINKSGDTLNVFLPSFITIDKLKINGNYKEIIIDGIKCVSSLPNYLSFNQPYRIVLSLGRKNIQGEIVFHKSDNIACLFLDTETKSLKRLLSDKNIREGVSSYLYLSNGDCCYVSDCDTIKGRGNSSWNCPKKSWSYTLSNSNGLLGMSSQRHWALLANFYDQTHLRNKLAYSYASSTLESWSPQCNFVDLFVNGRYQGLYLLTQKIEEDNYGYYSWNKDQCVSLCSCEAPDRIGDMDIYFLTDLNVPIEVSLPKHCNTKDLLFVKNSVNRFEKSLKTKSIENTTDVSSWVNKYLFEEILANTDGGKISSYFSITKDGKLVAGPCWDYDATWGINLWGRDPFGYYVKTPIFSKDYTNPWFKLLCDNNDFWSNVKQQYLSSFRSKYIQLIEKELPLQDSIIRSARIMDRCRWREILEILDKNLGGNQDVASMQLFMQKRLHFFDDIFIFDKQYQTITVVDSTITSPCNKYSVLISSDESLQEEVTYFTPVPRPKLFFSRIILLFWGLLVALLIFLSYFYINRNV